MDPNVPVVEMGDTERTSNVPTEELTDNRMESKKVSESTKMDMEWTKNISYCTHFIRE